MSPSFQDTYRIITSLDQCSASMKNSSIHLLIHNKNNDFNMNFYQSLDLPQIIFIFDKIIEYNLPFRNIVIDNSFKTPIIDKYNLINDLDMSSLYPYSSIKSSFYLLDLSDPGNSLFPRQLNHHIVFQDIKYQKMYITGDHPAFDLSLEKLFDLLQFPLLL